MKLTKEEMLAWMLDKVKSSTNAYDAECWLVTARTLGVNYDVDLCTYKLHCQYKNVNSASETLQRMYLEFNSEPRFWEEAMQLVEAVRDDSANDDASLFHRAVFQTLLPELQQTILLELAEKQKEKVDQCRFLLLLLRLCPDSASTFGIQLIEVLTDLEKTAEATEPHENIYAQLFVCDVLPILLRSQTLKLSENVCLELFKRAIRFYLSILSSSQRRKQSVTGSGGGTTGSSSAVGSPRAPRFKSSSRGSETPIADFHLHQYQSESVSGGSRSSDNNNWESLLQCFSMIAGRCRWEVGKKLKNFRLDHLRNILSRLGTSSPSKTEALFTALLIFFNLVFKYSQLAGVAATGESPNVVAALVPPTLRESCFPPSLLPASEAEGPTAAKKAKTGFSKEDVASATLVPSSDNDKALSDIFSVGAACSKLLGEGNRDELVEKLLPKDKRVWVKQFVRDSQLLSGEFRRLSKELEKNAGGDENAGLTTTDKSQLAGCYLALEKNTLCVKTLLSSDFTDSSSAAVSSFHAGTALHSFASDDWHFAFVSEQQLLAYTVRCLLYCLGKKIADNVSAPQLSDVILGHTIVLCQYEWPKLMWLFTAIMNRVTSTSAQLKRTKFSYPRLFTYVYTMDMLEEIAYVSRGKAGDLTLDITETETTRKIGASTRHSVKDHKDDVKSMLEAQASVAGSALSPSLYEIFLLFLSEQKDSLKDLL